MKDYIKINDRDSVIVALRPLKKDTVIEGIKVLENIPAGHKMAVRDIASGTAVIKYGACIGKAKKDIKAGEWVHIHNIGTGLGEILDYTYEPNEAVRGTDSEVKSEAVNKVPDETFMGYVRTSGQVAVRNEIWIIPTVGCVNNIATAAAARAQSRLAQRDERQRSRIDSIAAFTHPYGCSQMGDDQEHTRAILSDLIRHPNAAGVLVLGLGCENSNIDVLKAYIGEYDERRVKFLVCQEVADEAEAADTLIDELIEYASEFEREPISVSKLIIGMKCGGSDGLSGITANPLIGRFSDMLVNRGGTTILTEVPEMFGAETILMNRCADEKTFDKTVCLINDFKKYFTDNHQIIYDNPSPGNKKGGISTLEDKALGCTQKSGSSAVRDVLTYGERVVTPGLNLLSAPGNDLVATTALAASGAHLVLFSTGRGTPFAGPVPTVKISSNSALAQNKTRWIDFNAGVLAEDADAAILAREFFDYVIRVASGEQVASERAGFHDMAIFKQGVTL